MSGGCSQINLQPAVIPYDPDAAPKLMRYVPEWAASHRERGT